MLVKDYMTRNVITLTPDMEILKALLVLAENDIAGAPVLDERALVGILTGKDCLKSALRAAYHSEYGGVLATFMSRDVVTVAPDDGLVQVAQQFVERPFHRYPVMEEGTMVGIISRRDVIQALARKWQ